jgi:hypothetical protein
MTRLAIAMLLWSSFARSQPRRKVGTVVSGEQWRDEEVALTLQLLEIMGRSDIPVMLGAAFPLVRTGDEALQWQERYGKVSYSGLGRALVARGVRCACAGRRRAHHQGLGRRCCAFPGADGAQVSRRSYHL